MLRTRNRARLWPTTEPRRRDLMAKGRDKPKKEAKKPKKDKGAKKGKGK